MALSSNLKVQRITNSIYESNTYILSSIMEEDEVVWLVDVGDVDKVLRVLSPKARVLGVLFTHTHYDHIYGVNELLKIFPQAQLITNAYGKKALCSSKLNYSRYHLDVDDVQCESINNIVEAQNLQNITLGNDVVATLNFTPGHDASCITYVVAEYVFSGDSYIPGVETRATFLSSDKNAVASSERLIQDLSKGKTLCPGHGDITLIG